MQLTPDDPKANAGVHHYIDVATLTNVTGATVTNVMITTHAFKYYFDYQGDSLNRATYIFYIVYTPMQSEKLSTHQFDINLVDAQSQLVMDTKAYNRDDYTTFINKTMTVREGQQYDLKVSYTAGVPTST